MGAILGSFIFDLWRGEAPPPVKSRVEVIYRPGQAIAAARILPNQSTPGQFEGVAIVDAATASYPHSVADSYRAVIGSVLALTWHGQSYQSVLVQDVSVMEITKLIAASGIHPGAGSPYSYAPAARIVSRWQIVRLA